MVFARQKNGLSMIEVVVAVALLVAVSLIFSQLMSNAFKSRNRVAASTEFTVLTHSVLQVLQFERSCTGGFVMSDGTTLVDFNPASLPVNIPILKAGSAPGAPAIIDMSKPSLSNGLTITKFAITSATSLGSATLSGVVHNRYLAKIELEAKREGSPPLEQDFFSTLLVNSTTNKISACDTSSSSNDLEITLESPNTTNWACIDDLDIQDICGGDKGCTWHIRFFEKAGTDQVYNWVAGLLYEQPGISGNAAAGRTGAVWAGSTYTTLWFYSGTSGQYDMLNAASTVYISTYKRAACPGSGGSAGPALAPYHVSVAVSPTYRARITVHRGYF